MSLDLIRLVTRFEPSMSTVAEPLLEAMRAGSVDELDVVVEHNRRENVWLTSFWLDQAAREKLSVEPVARALSAQGLVFASGEWPHASLWEAKFFENRELVAADPRGFEAIHRGWERLLQRSISQSEWFDLESHDEVVAVHRASGAGLTRLADDPKHYFENHDPASRGPAFLFDARAEDTEAGREWERDNARAIARYDAFWGTEATSAEARAESGVGRLLHEVFPVRAAALSLELVDYRLREPEPRGDHKEPAFSLTELVLRTVKWSSDGKVDDVVEQPCGLLPRLRVWGEEGRWTDRSGTPRWLDEPTQDRLEQSIRALIQKIASRAERAMTKIEPGAPTPLPSRLVYEHDASASR